MTLELKLSPWYIDKIRYIDATTELTIANPNFFDLELYRQDGSGTKTTGKVLKAEDKVKVLIDTPKSFVTSLGH
ncbi:MAG: hypothetical protein R2822_06885 [Spirosomataceae bacterium]